MPLTECLKLLNAYNILSAVKLSVEEEALYTKVHTAVHNKWLGIRAHGAAYINKYILSITSLLLPLRRICSGGVLQDADLNVPELDRASGEAAGGLDSLQAYHVLPLSAL